MGHNLKTEDSALPIMQLDGILQSTLPALLTPTSLKVHSLSLYCRLSVIKLKSEAQTE